jgi:hypothetical protein
MISRKDQLIKLNILMKKFRKVMQSKNQCQSQSLNQSQNQNQILKRVQQNQLIGNHLTIYFKD